MKPLSPEGDDRVARSDRQGDGQRDEHPKGIVQQADQEQEQRATGSIITTEQDMLGGRREIGKTSVPSGRPPASTVCAPSAGQHQERLCADRRGREQVAQGVADRRDAARSTLKQPAMRSNMPGLGLRQMQCRVDRMRAIENGVDAAAAACTARHLVVDGVQRVHVEQPATDARLVGRHHHLVAGLIEAGDGFQAAGDRSPFGRRLDELLRVVVDDAVAVEDDEFHTASFAMSATALSCSKSAFRRPRRLPRSSGHREH
jgi:hypothetical protein